MILVQSSCPMKIEITQFSDGFKPNRVLMFVLVLESKGLHLVIWRHTDRLSPI